MRSKFLISFVVVTHDRPIELYGFYDLMANASYDDLWNLAIRAAGVRATCSEAVSLVYHLGGSSNASAIERWRILKDQGRRSTHGSPYPCCGSSK